jgi:hypothetical protein
MTELSRLRSTLPISGLNTSSDLVKNGCPEFPLNMDPSEEAEAQA